MSHPILQFLPQEVIDAKLEKLRCAKCRLYLNVPPIMTSNCANICGRCYNDEDYNDENRPYHNRAYEALVRFFPFPCQYRLVGCEERRCGDSLFGHEKMCTFRPYQCPVYACDWAGIVNGLQKHFEEHHSQLYVVTGIISFDMQEQYDRHYLIVDNDILFMFRCSFEKSLEQFRWDAICINALETSNAYRMELEFRKQTPASSSIVFRMRFDNEHLEISGRLLQQLLDGAEQLTANISVSLIENNNIGPTDRALLNEVECPVCNRHMVPPIYLCSNGHSLCNCCKQRIANCPICRVPLGSVHNHALEKCVEQMRYPCRYNGHGCRFVAPSAEIRIHEEICPLRTE